MQSGKGHARIGRIQLRCRRALISLWPNPVRVPDLLAWAYPRISKAPLTQKLTRFEVGVLASCLPVLFAGMAALYPKQIQIAATPKGPEFAWRTAQSPGIDKGHFDRQSQSSPRRSEIKPDLQVFVDAGQMFVDPDCVRPHLQVQYEERHECC